MDFIIASALFAAIFVFALLLFNGTKKESDQKTEINRRLTRPAEDSDLDITRKRRPDQGKLGSALSSLNILHKLEEMMWQAGMYMRVSDMLLIIVLLFGGGMFLGQAVMGGMLFATAAGLLFASVPILYIQFRKKRRLRTFGQQLPFALDLIKSSLEAGHSLQRALQVVVAEFADPLGLEFRTVLEQGRLGLPLPRALDDMLKRVPEDDLRLLTVAVKVQTEVGSSLAQIVGRLSEIVRIRQRLRLQIHALTAQARMGGWVVGLLPVAVLFIFSLIQPSYTHTLFYDPTGQVILKVALGLDLTAVLIIRRLMRVSY